MPAAYTKAGAWCCAVPVGKPARCSREEAAAAPRAVAGAGACSGAGRDKWRTGRGGVGSSTSLSPVPSGDSVLGGKGGVVSPPSPPSPHPNSASSSALTYPPSALALALPFASREGLPMPSAAALALPPTACAALRMEDSQSSPPTGTEGGSLAAADTSAAPAAVMAVCKMPSQRLESMWCTVTETAAPSLALRASAGTPTMWEPKREGYVKAYWWQRAQAKRASRGACRTSAEMGTCCTASPVVCHSMLPSGTRSSVELRTLYARSCCSTDGHTAAVTVYRTAPHPQANEYSACPPSPCSLQSKTAAGKPGKQLQRTHPRRTDNGMLKLTWRPVLGSSSPSLGRLTMISFRNSVAFSPLCGRTCVCRKEATKHTQDSHLPPNMRLVRLLMRQLPQRCS